MTASVSPDRENNRSGRQLVATLVALLLSVLPIGQPALAGSFQVNPVSIELLPGHRTASLTVRNTGAETVSVRVRLYRWTQQDGEDVYSETDQVISSPPIFTIAPNARQLIRIGSRGEPLRGAYRVILEEIPGPRRDPAGISVALRINLPLYVIADPTTRPALTWSAWHTSSGEMIIEARNSGGRHAQILGLATTDRSGREIQLSSQMGVVLPGSSKRWNVGRQAELVAGSDLQLSARDGGGQVSRPRVRLEQR